MRLGEVPSTWLGGLKVACLDRRQMVEVMAGKIAADRDADGNSAPMLVFDANGHSVSLVNSSAEMRELYAHADLVHADGQSVVSLSRRFGGRAIPERSATTDMIHDVPRLHRQPLRHFLLGATPDVVTRCVNILSARYDNFQVVGSQHGFYDREREAELVERINATRPDILWVGMGKPEEQRFAVRNRQRLRVPVVVTCGGCYNYITGDYRRAPARLQALGLEWLHRMVTNPRQLAWRYLSTNPHAVWCVLKHHYLSGRAGSMRADR